MTSPTESSISRCLRANRSNSGRRAMVPSELITSQITPAGASPAMRARSTEPSVWPARTRTPPSRARSGNTCPGRTRSPGLASGATATWIVLARSAAEIPVVTPDAASIETVKAVPKGEVFSCTINGRFSLRIRSSVIERQISPRPCVAMKLMVREVTFSAAITRSPSFSRVSSSVRITIRPRRMSCSARWTSAMLSWSRWVVRATVSLRAAGEAGALEELQGHARRARAAPQRVQARHVFANEIRLHVRARALRLLSQRGPSLGFRNQHHREAIATHIHHREADPIHRHRSLLHQERADRLGKREAQHHRFTLRTPVEDGGHRVHVTRDQVPPEPIAQSERALQIDAGTRGPLTEGRTAKRLRRGLDAKALAAAFDHRQAHPVPRDGLAVLELVRSQRGANPQIDEPTGGHALDRSHVLNQAGEHPRGL